LIIASQLYQVTQGLQYLHSVDIAHGALKGVSSHFRFYPPDSTFILLMFNSILPQSNVLINSSGRVWLADYGLSPFRRYQREGNCHSPWDAPEVIIRSLVEDLVHKPADIFSFAMLVLEVFTGERPFGRRLKGNQACLRITKGVRPQRPEGVDLSDDVWGLVQHCWAQVPGERPIIDDVIKTWEQMIGDSRWVSSLVYLAIV
jgi:serine/threonine protein kinase